MPSDVIDNSQLHSEHHPFQWDSALPTAHVLVSNLRHPCPGH